MLALQHALGRAIMLRQTSPASVASQASYAWHCCSEQQSLNNVRNVNCQPHPRLPHALQHSSQRARY